MSRSLEKDEQLRAKRGQTFEEFFLKEYGADVTQPIQHSPAMLAFIERHIDEGLTTDQLAELWKREQS